MNPGSATKYFVLIFVGFCGMIVCHFFILILLGLGDEAGRQVPFYALTYPLIFGAFAFVLSSRNRDNAILNSLALCSIPTLYWFGLLLYDGKFDFGRLSFYDSTGMMLIMPMTIAVSMMIMVIVSRKKIVNS